MRRVLLIAAPACLVLTGCMAQLPTLPSQQASAEEPVNARLAEIERRLESIERVVRNQSLVSMAQQVDALERRVDALHGTTEELAFDASSTSDRQRDLYADLDARIQALSERLNARPAQGSAPAATASTAMLTTGTDRENYQAAFQLLRDRQYQPAAAAFERFLMMYPDSELAGNAQYWLAESYYVTQSYNDALSAFRIVVDGYPDSSKVADAILKIGFCHYELKNWDAARQALAQVRSEYPDTTAARLAAQRLERMAGEGV